MSFEAIISRNLPTRVLIALLLAAVLLLPAAGSAARNVDAPDAGASGGKSVESGEDSVKVSVFYATNRLTEDETPETYGGERGAPRFGRCEVEFKPVPVINHVASRVPFYVPSETSEVRVSELRDDTEFWEQLNRAVSQTASGSVVVFVHGYNYGFAKTCGTAADMQRNLEGKATVVMLSWPSNGLPTDYVRDQADVEWSVPFIADFLVRLGDRIGPENVQVVAHSLGSRGVLFALQRMGAGRDERPVAGRLVLLAPDFDAQTFVGLLPRLQPLAGDITLYASGNDAPLKLSRQLSGYPRLGEGGEFLTVVDGVETVDVSGIRRYQILGHEYFLYHPLVAADLTELLSQGTGAAQRSGLREKQRDGMSYWEVVTPAAP